MSRFRRRHLSPEMKALHARFLAVVEPVEAAKEAVVGAVPQARYPGRNLVEALGDYDRRLEAAQALMPGWRHPVLEPDWLACSRGLERARSRAESHLGRAGPGEEDPGEIGFESLLEVVQGFLDPLEPFADTEERFRSLRS